MRRFNKQLLQEGEWWGWIFHSELGYRIIEDEEDVNILAKLMRKILRNPKSKRWQARK